MKKNIVLVLIILVAVLIGGFCWVRFCNSGRYQVLFGNLQQSYSQVLTPDVTGEKYTRHETEEKVVPVCIKFDTVTGRVWIYEHDYTVWADYSTTEIRRFREVSQ